MAKKNVNTNLVIVLLVLVGLLGYALLAQAGNLEPSAAPAPTMKTLQEVYDAASGGINEREGYCQYFEVPADSNEVIFAVPAGKCFSLLILYQVNVAGLYWSLNVDDEVIIKNLGNIERHEFPDRCVVVKAGETLKIINENPSETGHVTIIGYFYDAP